MLLRFALCGVQGSGFKVQGSGFKVQRFKVQGSGSAGHWFLVAGLWLLLEHLAYRKGHGVGNMETMSHLIFQPHAPCPKPAVI
jgi:hypothetical protein